MAGGRGMLKLLEARKQRSVQDVERFDSLPLRDTKPPSPVLDSREAMKAIPLDLEKVRERLRGAAERQWLEHRERPCHHHRR
jgi:hypothetical protein